MRYRTGFKDAEGVEDAPARSETGAAAVLYYIIRTVRAFSLCVLVIAAAACGGSGLFRQYEYEEEMYLSLDGRATIFVNSSIQALNALRGTSFDARPTARVDRDAVRRYFTGPEARVTRVTTSRRRGRQFVHVRLEVDDIERLAEAKPFAWSTYRLDRQSEIVVFKQGVGAAASDQSQATAATWDGDELAAFRIHIPSVVEWHNAGADNLRRGNIVVWEQPLAERLRGVPLDIEVRMEPQSILYSTLLLFAAMFGLVAMVFGGTIWWVARKGRAASA